MEATPYRNGHGRHAVTLSLIAVDHLLILISRPGVIRSPISIARYVIGTYFRSLDSTCNVTLSSLSFDSFVWSLPSVVPNLPGVPLQVDVSFRSSNNVLP